MFIFYSCTLYFAIGVNTIRGMAREMVNIYTLKLCSGVLRMINGLDERLKLLQEKYGYSQVTIAKR